MTKGQEEVQKLTQRRVLEKGAIMRKTLQGNLLLMRRLQGNLLHPEIRHIFSMSSAVVLRMEKKPEGQLGCPWREHRFLECSHESHTSSSSSFWSRLYGEFTIYQESTPEVCETVVPSDRKMDRGSERNQYCDKASYVFADSVFCLGSMRDEPIEAWENKIKWYSENNHFKELNRIDGMPTEFEWKIFPGITALGLLEKIHDLMKDLQCELE